VQCHRQAGKAAADDQDVVFVFHDTSCLSGCISGLPGPGGSFYICFFHLAACMPLGFGLRLSTSRPACRSDSTGTGQSAGTVRCPVSSTSAGVAAVGAELAAVLLDDAMQVAFGAFGPVEDGRLA